MRAGIRQGLCKENVWDIDVWDIVKGTPPNRLPLPVKYGQWLSVLRAPQYFTMVWITGVPAKLPDIPGDVSTVHKLGPREPKRPSRIG